MQDNHSNKDKLIELTEAEHLDALMKCPVCAGYMTPPIMQCSHGHLICKTCRNKLNNECPVCHVPIGIISNLAMDRIGSKLVTKCSYACHGCRVHLSYALKEAHELDCLFRPYDCPYTDQKCVWQGPLKDVHKHFVSTHHQVTTIKGHDIIFLATNVHQVGALDWTLIQSCHSRHFLLSLEKVQLGEGSPQYFASCRIIGTMRDANEYDYVISLRTKDRSLFWKSKPGSICESVETYTNNDFLVLNKSTVKMFAVDGQLALNVLIKKVSNGAQTLQLKTVPGAICADADECEQA